MTLLNAGDVDCTTGIAKRIYDQLTSDNRNMFSTPLTATQDAAVKAICYAAALGIADEVNADGGIGGGGGGLTGSGIDGRIARWVAGALADTGLFMDGSNRLSLPVGLIFPGGSTQDVAGVSGTGTSGKLVVWTGTTSIGNASLESWNVVGTLGKPSFTNGWGNY